MNSFSFAGSNPPANSNAGGSMFGNSQPPSFSFGGSQNKETPSFGSNSQVSQKYRYQNISKTFKFGCKINSSYTDVDKRRSLNGTNTDPKKLCQLGD